MARLPTRRVLALSLAVVCALFAAGVYWLRGRSAALPSNLVALLPSANSSIVYIDVNALRRSGILGMIAGSKTTEEPDYQQFVQETEFDYTHDLDAVAAALKDGRTYFALRGRFHWDHLADYAVEHGGSCHNGFCVLSGSQPHRRISFYLLAPQILALAAGPDDFAAYQVTRQPGTIVISQPKDPVWAIIPASALQSMDTLPAAAKAFLPALQGADQIVLSIGASSGQQLQLGVHVTCQDAGRATALLAQLESITKTLRDVAARQHAKPDPGDFTGVLLAGNFRRDQSHVYGIWPIPKAFVDAIAGASQ
jgi:hypothetical protein